MERKLYAKGTSQDRETPVVFELTQDGSDVNIYASYDGKKELIAFFSAYGTKVTLELMRGLDSDVFAVDEDGFLKPTL